MRVLHEPEAGSSNDRVVEIALASGVREPVALRVDRQSGARGRLGRSWHAPHGGVWLSVAWPCAADAVVYEPAPVLVGLAVHAAVSRWLGTIGRAVEAWHLRVKWPNDVLVDDRKLAGVLCERPHVGGGAWLVIGVGMNVDTPSGVPGTEHAIGLREAFGDAPAVDDIAGVIVEGIAARLHAIEASPATAIAAARAAIEPVLAYRGRRVRVSVAGRADRVLTGVVAGVDERLRLVLAGDDGRLTACAAGEVERLRANDADAERPVS